MYFDTLHVGVVIVIVRNCFQTSFRSILTCCFYHTALNATPSTSEQVTLVDATQAVASTLLHQQQQQQEQALRYATNIASVAYFDESGKVDGGTNVLIGLVSTARISSVDALYLTLY